MEGSIKSTVAHAPPDLNIMVPQGKFLLLMICLNDGSSKPRIFLMNSNLLMVDKDLKKSVGGPNLEKDYRVIENGKEKRGKNTK